MVIFESFPNALTPNSMRNYLLQTTWIIIFCIALPLASWGQNNDRPIILHLDGKDVQLPVFSPGILSTHQPEASEIINGNYYRLLQFNTIPTQEARESLEKTGIRLLDYLPENTYVASIPKGYDLNHLVTYNIRAFEPFHASLKIAETIHELPYPEWAVPFDGGLDVGISLYRDIKMTEILPLLSEYAEEILDTDQYSNTIIIRILSSQIKALAGLPFLHYISPVDPPSEPENYTAKTITRSNTIDNQFTSGRHYNGNGVKVMLQDDGMIGPHIDYQGRIGQQYTTDPTGTHGDHIAGTIMGAGNMDPKTKGMAPAAEIYVYNVYDGIDSIPQHYFNPGVVITSTSYSNGCNAGYTAFARTHDQQVRQYPSLMHVFSSGNSGTSNCSYGAGSGWGNITGGHKVGKNVIAVGNLNEYDVLNSSSSRGPAHDGRIKPDICAKGTSVYSTIPTNQYQSSTGTSMSCPNISGSLAQLYSAYKEFNSGNNPPSALMKAIILNTADDLGNPGPDYKHGWGRINNLRAAKVIENTTYFSDTITHNTTKNHNIIVPAGTQQVRVMVYWADWEALAGAAKALVNDINIQLTAPSTTVYNPWVLDPTPNVTNLDANAVRGIDSLNNVEQVTIDNPASGTYMLTVNGANIPQGPQTYYVVYEFVTDEITVTYPMGGESLVPGETELVRWDAFGNSGNFSLQYSSDSGSSWTTLSNSVAGNLRQYTWTVPNHLTGNAIIKVTRGTSTDVSDVPFSIIGVPANLNVQWSCSNYFRVRWDSVAGATAYEVTLLGTKYMDSVGTTSNLYFDITGVSSGNEYYYSVKALGPYHAYGRRAIAAHKAAGSFGCPSPNNAGLSSFISPAASTMMDCQSSNLVDITVIIENVATNTLTNIPVRYRIHSGPIVSETFTGSLTSGASTQFTFATNANLSVVGNYIIKAWVDYPGDVEHDNDTISKIVQIIPGTLINLPHQENFESFTLCSTAATCEQVTCAMANGWLNEWNSVGDDIDWRANAGSTPSSGTGPSTDHNPGTSSGKYLYTEASGTCDGREAILISPCINLANTTNPKMNYWYHMSGTNMGTLAIDVYSNGIWTTVKTISGNQGTAWQGDTIDLSSYIGDTVNVRFKGTTGIDYLSDIAIDDIGFFQLTNYPQAAFSENVQSGCAGAAIQFYDQSYNTPTTWQWTFTPSTVTFVSGTTAGSQHPVVRFDNAGNYDVKLVASNSFGSDSITKTGHIYIDQGAALPLYENFESFAACGTSSNCSAEVCPLGNDWINAINGAEDDIDWRVDAGGTPSSTTGPAIDHNPGTSSGNYVYLEASNGCTGQTATLISPCIDLNNTSNPALSFWYHMYGADMGSLHIDIFTNGSWLNDITSVLLGNQGNSWLSSIVDLSNYIGQVVQVRFRGITGSNYASDMALDDIAIIDLLPPDAGFISLDTVCVNTSFIITDTSKGYGVSYSWDFGSGASPSSASTKGPHVVSFNTPGQKTVKLIATNQAGSDTSTRILWVDEMPVADFGISSNGGTISFSDSSSGASSHYWDFGDGSFSNLQNPSHPYTATGLYYVTQVVYNTCGNDSTVKTVWVVMPGIYSPNSSEFGVEIYPNPSEGIFLVTLDRQDKYHWKVTDITGKLIGQANEDFEKKQQFQIDLSKEASGVYFLQIHTKKASKLIKLVLQ